jgi:hypothetical protein
MIRDHRATRASARFVAVILHFFVLSSILGLSPLVGADLYGQRKIYVSTNGSDSNPGTSTRPVRSIQKAVNLAGAGDEILVRGGTYGGTVHISKSGRAELARQQRGRPQSPHREQGERARDLRVRGAVRRDSQQRGV